MPSDSRPFARRAVVALCVVPLLAGLIGQRSEAATRLSPRLAPAVTSSVKARPTKATRSAAGASRTRRSKGRPAEASTSETVTIPLGAHDTGPARRKAGRISAPSAAPGTLFSTEVEPNDDTDTATPITGASGRLRGNISELGDQDFYAFTAAAGDRVYAATATAFADSDGSRDTLLQILASDGTTVVESDDDDGSFDKGSSSIAGAAITTPGIYYLRVTEGDDDDQIRPYDLYFRLQSGSPTAETEPNDTTANAQPIPESGWVSGSTSADVDVDLYSISLAAGDTIYLGLDLDPERDATAWDGLVGLAGFGDPATLLAANGGGGDAIPSESFFFTVKSAGTYYVYVGAANKGEFGTYRLSATVFSRPDEIPCAAYASADVPKTIDSGPPNFVASTLVVPGNARIAHLRVNLDVTHDFMTDLDVTLTAPNGETIVLFTGAGSFTEGQQTSMSVTLDDDNALPISEFEVVDDIAPAPEPQYRLEWFNGIDAGGTWTLTVYDDFEDNGGTLDGWGLEICEDASTFCESGTPTAIFDEDFEADDGGFSHGGTNDEWEWGTPTAAPIDDANSGTKAWKTDLDGAYDDDSYQDLVSPSITLPAGGDLRLSWAQKYQLESAEYDRVWVQIDEIDPIRGGGRSRRLFEHLGPTMEDLVGNPVVTVEEAAGWSLCERDISDFAGLTVRITWHLDSDMIFDYAGYAVDDVKIVECVPTPNADLSIVLSDSPDPVAAGGNVTYTFMAGNGGPDDAGATTVSLPLPAGTTFVSASAPVGWSVSTPPVGANGTVTFSIGNFADCDSAEFTVVAAVGCAVANGSVLTATATVAGTTGDTNPANDSATATTTVTNAAPTISSCPSNVSTSAGAGVCSAVVTFTTPTATDDSGCTATVVCSPASGAAFSVGVTTVTCTATDAASQTGSCSFTVTVADAEPPSISCPGNVTVISATPSGQPVSYTTPTASDNCSGASVVCAPASGSTFALGTTTVTCTATDAANNTASCSFTVAVVQHDTAGVYIPSTNAWFLRNTNTSGPADVSFIYGGTSTWVPIKGDWNDDGVDTPGLYDPATGTFYLRNSNAPGPADVTFTFGAPNGGFTPIAGDWNGDGVDSVGLYNPATGVFFLKNANAGGGADLTFVFGAGGAGLVPVAGNWDGTGGDSVGVYNPATSVFFLKNTNAAGGADLVFQFGQTGGGFLPIAGDWNNDGVDTVGVYNPSTAGFFLTDTAPSITADYIFVYGPTNATPIVGNWDGF